MVPARFRLFAILAFLFIALLISYLYVDNYGDQLQTWLPNRKWSSNQFSSSNKPRPGEVVLVTASSGTNGFQGVPHVKEMVYENRMSYAHRHDYDFMWAETTSYNFGPKIYWNKIPILQEAFRRFPRAQWVWWLDLDAIIMTSSLDLHAHILSAEGMEPKLARGEFLRGAGGFNTTMTMPATFKPADANFIVDNGGWGINVGSFFMRRGGWSDWVLEMWADPLATAKDWMFPEQDGFIHMWMHHEVVRNHTALMRQRALDSYSPWNPNGANYEDGDLVVHFAGCGNNTFCEERWHTMWDRREPSEVPAFVKEQLASGTAPIEGVQKGVGL